MVLEKVVKPEIFVLLLISTRDVLNVEASDLIKRTDLEEETVNDVLAVIHAEFE